MIAVGHRGEGFPGDIAGVGCLVVNDRQDLPAHPVHRILIKGGSISACRSNATAASRFSVSICAETVTISAFASKLELGRQFIARFGEAA